MPCLLLLLILFFPRLILFLAWIFTHWLGHAFPHYSFLIAVGGFIFAPLTTIVYAYIVAHNPGFSHHLTNMQMLWVGLAILIDLSGWGGGFRSRRR